MRVHQLPADLVERLRRITPELLAERLGVLAQWKLVEGKYVVAPLGNNLNVDRGVRREGDQLQMGLTRLEIRSVYRLLTNILGRVDSGDITLLPAKVG
jgi:hypothetical protein